MAMDKRLFESLVETGGNSVPVCIGTGMGVLKKTGALKVPVGPVSENSTAAPEKN